MILKTPIKALFLKLKNFTQNFKKYFFHRTQKRIYWRILMTKQLWLPQKKKKKKNFFYISHNIFFFFFGPQKSHNHLSHNKIETELKYWGELTL